MNALSAQKVISYAENGEDVILVLAFKDIFVRS